MRDISLHVADFVSESDMKTFEEYLSKMGDDILENELHFKVERTLLSSIAMTLGIKMLHPFMDYWYKKDRSKKALLAFEMDGYIKKLMWRNWHTDYLKARVNIPAKRNYAAKIRKVIEKMMEEDWSNIQNGL